MTKKPTFTVGIEEEYLLVNQKTRGLAVDRNQRWRHYASMLISENRWRAQRYGLDEGLVDFGKREIVPFANLLEELIGLVVEDAEALECKDEILHLRTIMKRGTSAHRQLAVYEKARMAGKSDEAALIAVVDQLVAETVEMGKDSFSQV